MSSITERTLQPVAGLITIADELARLVSLDHWIEADCLQQINGIKFVTILSHFSVIYIGNRKSYPKSEAPKVTDEVSTRAGHAVLSQNLKMLIIDTNTCWTIENSFLSYLSILHLGRLNVTLKSSRLVCYAIFWWHWWPSYSSREWDAY